MISDNAKRGKKKRRDFKICFNFKKLFFLKQRVDSYNFRPEIYLLFSTGQKLTNLFSTGSFFKSGKDLSSLQNIFFK